MEVKINHGIRSLDKAISGNENVITGYASVFNSETTIVEAGGRRFREVIKPGSFKLKQPTWCLYNHNKDLLLGSTENGTLTLEQDDKGLRFSVTLPDSPTGNEVRALVARGDLSGASFGFSSARAKLVTGGELPLHEIYSVDLEEVSLTYCPAYSQARVGFAARSLAFRFKELLLKEITSIVHNSNN